MCVQIAGIHGLPFAAYDGIMGTDHQNLANTNYLPSTQWGGYCWHGSQVRCGGQRCIL